MANLKNTTLVEELKEKLGKAKSVVITDYRGLTHKQAEQLHATLKSVGAEYVVVKNSLLKLASDATSFELPKGDLFGPTAALISYEDEVAPLKELAKFIKTTTFPKIKFGFVSGQRYDEAQVTAISKLPGKDVLQGQVVSRLSGPMYGLVYALNGNLQKLVYILGQIKN